MKKQYYVAGFLFNKKRDVVALIKKNKPEFMAGQLNAIGGKIEEDEFPKVAQQREFLEEAGVDIPISEWEFFLTLEARLGVVHFFRAFSDDIYKVKSMEIEQVSLYETYAISSLNTVPNLKWITPLALDKLVSTSTIIREIHND